MVFERTDRRMIAIGYFTVNKAIVDYTSPALCAPVTPFPAYPIFSECGSDGMIPCAA